MGGVCGFRCRKETMCTGQEELQPNESIIDRQAEEASIFHNAIIYQCVGFEEGSSSALTTSLNDQVLFLVFLKYRMHESFVAFLQYFVGIEQHRNDECFGIVVVNNGHWSSVTQSSCDPLSPIVNASNETPETYVATRSAESAKLSRRTHQCPKKMTRF
jgi:hypothetical protein